MHANRHIQPFDTYTSAWVYICVHTFVLIYSRGCRRMCGLLERFSRPRSRCAIRKHRTCTARLLMATVKRLVRIKRTPSHTNPQTSSIEHNSRFTRSYASDICVQIGYIFIAYLHSSVPMVGRSFFLSVPQHHRSVLTLFSLSSSPSAQSVHPFSSHI